MDVVAQTMGIDRARHAAALPHPPRKCPTRSRSRHAPARGSSMTAATTPPARPSCWWSCRMAVFRATGRGADPRKYLGIGLAHAVKGTGRGPFETGIVRVAPPGRVSIFTGASAMGQGLATALSQICAAELGHRARASGRDRGRYGDGAVRARRLRQPTARHRGLVGAARGAGGAQAKQLASHLLEATRGIWSLPTARCASPGVTQRGIRLGEIARVLRGAPGYRFPPGPVAGARCLTRPFMTDVLAYANAFHVAEVEVDIDTGAVRILAYHAIQGFRRADQSAHRRRTGARRHRARHRQRAFRADGL